MPAVRIERTTFRLQGDRAKQPDYLLFSRLDRSQRRLASTGSFRGVFWLAATSSEADMLLTGDRRLVAGSYRRVVRSEDRRTIAFVSLELLVRAARRGLATR